MGNLKLQTQSRRDLLGQFFLMLPRYIDAHWKKKVAGGPGLKQTQLYTAEFGRAIAGWWRSYGPIAAGTGSLPLQADNVVLYCLISTVKSHVTCLLEQKFKSCASFASGGRGDAGVLFKAPICRQMQSRTALFHTLCHSSQS